MKPKKTRPMPELSLDEVIAAVSRTKTMNLRLTANEKKSISETAEGLGLTMTDYLLKCHALVVSKLRHK